MLDQPGIIQQGVDMIHFWQLTASIHIPHRCQGRKIERWWSPLYGAKTHSVGLDHPPLLGGSPLSYIHTQVHIVQLKYELSGAYLDAWGRIMDRSNHTEYNANTLHASDPLHSPGTRRRPAPLARLTEVAPKRCEVGNRLDLTRSAYMAGLCSVWSATAWHSDCL